MDWCRRVWLLAETAYFEYDAVGNRTTLVAPAGEVSYYGYDALDRLAWLRADAFGADAATYYSYDAVGNRTGLTDAELHTTSFAYDALRRLLHEQDALGKTEYYAYDAAGNLAHLTNGDGQTTYFAYDALDRRSQVAFPEGFSAYFDYDEVGNLTSASDTNETDDFAYDPLNRVASRAIAGVGTVYFAYDLAGRRTRLEDPKGAVVYYTFDKRGLTTRVDAPFGSTYYGYDARGAMLSKHLPNGTVAYHAYDDAGRLSKLENRKSDGTAISTFEFTRDANGNITTSLREDGSCWYYAYDGLQRLTGADWKDAGGVSLYAFEYDYDKVGNRLRFAQNGVSTYYAYNAANELTSEVTPGIETAYYAYDGRGNQTQRQVLGGHTLYFEYNSRNLIAAISSDDPAFTTNTFTYNALGQRITKTDSTGTTRYVWDGLHILLELDASGNVTRRYTHGSSPIEGVSDLLAVQDSLGCPCFYHFDQVGGVRQLTDRWQNAIKSYEFEPFGRILAEDGAPPNDLGFPATYVMLPGLEELRLSLTRLYHSGLGRFCSRDALARIPSYWWPRLEPLAISDSTGMGPIAWLVGWLYGSREAGEAFEASIGTSMIEQGREMAAGARVLAEEGIMGSRELLVNQMADRYTIMALQYGECRMYLIAANDMTGGTPVMEALGGIDLQTQRELSGMEAAQRILIGGGQVTLTVIGTTNQISNVSARLRGFKEFHFTRACRTSSIRASGLNRPDNYTTPRIYTSGSAAQKALNMPSTPDVVWRVRPPSGTLTGGPRPVVGGTGTEFVRSPIGSEFLKGPYSPSQFMTPTTNALTLGALGARMMTGFMPSGFVPGSRDCECRLREALDKLCGEDYPGPEGAR